MSELINVLTYNVHKGYASGRPRFVLEHMRTLLAESHADVVFLQEIHGEASGKRHIRADYPDRPHFEYLADQAWPHYAYGRNAIYRRGDHGNAILSKYPFVSWENIDVSLFPRSSRSILHGVIELPASGRDRPRRLHTLCVHFGLLELERQAQLQTLIDRIESHVPHSEPMILAGDFNDWRAKAELKLMRHLDLQELFINQRGRHARTFPVWWPILPMDRIYYRGVEALGASCLNHGPWRSLSDHAALFGQFRC